ncbi:TAXI family TRAP transporter solute-binding subunit [Marinomonas gallaica]|uniref:TAXI family TRAP transporter solute-binding subunit n=1 Tax=Marinomonas gallaica TaxID=1806667 RepID=UPI000830FEF8|nr:TAXI family TRAP transporter solute-binding subunit [Marinomonas gallaica]
MIKINNTFSLFLSAMLLSSLSFSAMAETLRLGSMPVGSGWYVGAAAIQKMVKESDSELDIEILARGGGVANPMVVNANKAQIGISNVATSQWAVEGMLLYNGHKATNIRSLVGGLNPVYIGAIARKEYMDENGFETLDDILSSGKPINIMMKPAGSNIPPVVETILALYNLDKQTIEAQGGSIIQVDSSQMSGLLRDKRVDLYFDTVLRGHPTITEISLTGDVEFLDMSDKAIAAFTSIGLTKGTYGKWFDSQTGENIGGDFGTHLIANASLSDEDAYEITKLVVENMDRLSEDFKAWKAFKREGAALPENNGIALHPGAIRYYKEIGLLP